MRWMGSPTQRNSSGSSHRPRPARNCGNSLNSTAWCSGLSALAASIRLCFAADTLVWLLVPQAGSRRRHSAMAGLCYPIALGGLDRLLVGRSLSGSRCIQANGQGDVGIHWRVSAATAVGGYDRPLERLYPMATDPSRPDVLGLLEQAKNSIIS